AQSVLHVFQRGIGLAVKQSFGGHHEPGSAEPTLLGIIVHKGLLNGMESARLAKSFDCRNLMPLRVNGQHRARINRLVVHQDRASAACSTIAYALGPCEL